MRLLLSLFITLFTLSVCYAQQLAQPTISVGSGVFSSDIIVSISHPEPGVTLFYTLNGSEPTPSSPVYTADITMSSRAGDPDNYALIPTNPSFTYPLGDYTLQRSNDRGWLPPYVNEIFKVNVLRVKAYKAGFVPSEVVTRTYIIDPLGSALYPMPILSMVMDSIDLFSNASGIYHYGNHPQGNYTQKGPAWERLAHLDYFDENGDLAFEREVRTRIHGGGSRHSTKKTFRIYAEHNGFTNFDYPFFENYELKKFKRILLRAGGHRPDCFPRDDLANLIAADLNVDHQHYRHIIVFLNGEYWGIHSIKERVDKYFIQNEYGIDDDQITILDQEYDVQDGFAADSLLMSKIELYADTSNMIDATDYQWMSERIDIENYIDYMSTEIFLSNEDWVYSNVVIWRKTGAFDPTLGPGHDGKFRWLLYDFDGAFGGSCDNAYYTVNTLDNATVSSGTYSTYTRLFRGLLKNIQFREEWINRTCDLMNSHFRANELHNKLDEFYGSLTQSMPEEIDRWRYPSVATTLANRQNEIPSLTQWDTSFYYLNRFADRRQRKVREHIMAKWGYPDTSQVTINVNDVSQGCVQINTILINEQLAGVNPGVYPWTGYYIDSVKCQLIAVPYPGYEFVEWLETGETNDTISWLPTGDTLYTAVFQPTTDYSPVLINELMPSNSDYLADTYGDHDDWLELFNPNAYPINLSNCSIARDAVSWAIPNGTIIQPNGYLLFWHDNEQYQGSDHVTFKLPNSNTTVFLYDQNYTVMDFLSYPQTTTDYSYGRYPNGSGTFGTFSSPTPRMNNNLSQAGEITKPASTLMGYPNPTQDLMQLNKTVNYNLFALDGKLILSGINTNQIDLLNVEAGTYVLHTDEGETLKIIVRK